MIQGHLHFTEGHSDTRKNPFCLSHCLMGYLKFTQDVAKLIAEWDRLMSAGCLAVSSFYVVSGTGNPQSLWQPQPDATLRRNKCEPHTHAPPHQVH